MIKKIYSLLFFAAFSFSAINAQTVTINENPTGTSPNIVFGTLQYHASEYLYRNAEFQGNFTTNAISQIAFNVGTVGSPTTFNNVNIYMQNVPATTNTLATGTYSNEGYTLVYSGPVTMGAVGFNLINLTTGFTRVAGTNLLLLIERTDNATHAGYVFVPSLDDPSGAAATTVSRRYNGAAALTAATTLSASTFRAAIQFISPLPIDASLIDIINFPEVSCFSTPLSMGVVLRNNGTTPIAASTAAVTVNITGANIYSATLSNAAVIAPNATETITFTGINVNAPGVNDYESYVNLAGDPAQTNDSLFTSGITADNITTFPAVEDAETDLPLVSYVSVLAGGQLWGIRDASTAGAYINGDMVDSLYPHGGQNFFIFDSYRNPNSTGFVTRLFSNCVTLTRSVAPGSNVLTFWMSHDTTFITAGFRDSLYISVSTDKGATWNRIGTGIARLDAAFAIPGWRQETIDLSAFGCQTIQIGFEGVSYWGNAFGIDDVTITSTGDLNCTTPVTLLSFTAQKANKANKLTWKTSQEINTLKFVIEQSSNGREFSEMGQVLASGNSTTERTYSFTHNLPARGANYYRIKMVDIDGRFKYSPIRSLQNLGNNEISSNPNPVTNVMQVGINAEKAGIANVVITDLSGKAVLIKSYSTVEGDNNFIINTAGLTAGSYIIKIQMSEDVLVKKFIKL